MRQASVLVLLTGLLLALSAGACSSSNAVGGNGEDSGDMGTEGDADITDGEDPGEGFIKDTDGVDDEDLQDEEEASEPEVGPEPEPDIDEVVDAPEIEEIIEPLCPDGEACDDEDPCTFDDQCDEETGGCAGVAYDCDDELFCTDDVCLGDGDCEFPQRPGFCFIEGECWWDGDEHPEEPCMECVTAEATDDWSNNDGNECQEPGICTVYQCLDGACVAGPKSCDDGNSCTEDACQPAVGCTHLPTEGPCDDKSVCTIGDFCYGGSCQPGLDSLVCGDGNVCTNDVCDAKQGCQHLPNSEACDDGSICTEDDVCAGGACSGTAINCDDGNACTDDLCFPEIGCFPVDNAAACDDGDYCTTGDICVGGTCVSGTGAPPCDDGNACTDDLCDPVSGCYYGYNFNPCNDGSVCTLGDHCQEGECVAGLYQIFCFDADPCTSDICDAEEGCNYPPNGAPCDDHNVCTSGDFCGEGGCVPGEQRLNCDDEDPCTNDFCNPLDGCYHGHNEAWCQDEDPCTSGDFCLVGECIPGDESIICDDANVCTTDACVTDIGCVFTPVEGECDDWDMCTPVDQCIAGECVGLGNVQCDDGNDCTDDSCDPNNGCVFVPINTAECMPRLVITYPPRGAQILYTPGTPKKITVTGYVVAPAVDAMNIFINEDLVFIAADGTFEHPLYIHQGVNVIDASFKDLAYRSDRILQTFQISSHYYENIEPVPGGFALLLGEKLLDDDNYETQDDLATFVWQAANGIDVQGLLPNPVAKGDLAWCDYEVKLKKLYYKFGDVEIKAMDGYGFDNHLMVEVPLTEISVPVDVDVGGFICSLASALIHVRIDALKVRLAIRPVLNADNTISFEYLDTEHELVGFSVSTDNDLIDFVYGFFEDDLPELIGTMLEDQVGTMLSDLLSDITASLAIETDVEVPIPLPGMEEPLSFHIVAEPAYVEVVAPNFAIAYDLNIVPADKGIPYDPLGSISSVKCLEGLGEWAPHDYRDIIDSRELNLAIWDDLLNKLLYSVWYSGLLEIDLTIDDILGLIGDGEEGGDPLEGIPVDIKTLKISAMLPPIVSTCGVPKRSRIEMGDLRVDASINFSGLEIDLVMYMTMIAGFDLKLMGSPEGDIISFAIADMDVLDVEIAEINDDLFEMGPVLGDMFTSLLFPLVLDAINDGDLFSFVLPALDLGELMGGLGGAGGDLPIEIDINSTLAIDIIELEYVPEGDILMKADINQVFEE